MVIGSPLIMLSAKIAHDLADGGATDVKAAAENAAGTDDDRVEVILLA